MEAVPVAGAASFIQPILNHLYGMVFVITGGPGFGKTSIIGCLSDLHYPVCPEYARELLLSLPDRPQVPGASGPIVDFERLVAGERIRFMESASPEAISFSDRGLPDQLAYSWYKGKTPSSFIESAVLTARYSNPVFVTPPWKEIYTRDEVRKESFEEASAIHELIVKAYLAYGYQMVEVPPDVPAARAEFILKFLGA